MQYTEKVKIKEAKSPVKDYLVTLRISRNEYDLISRLKKLKNLNSSQIIRFALSRLRKEVRSL
jgi:hypothetical protein